MLQHSVAAVEYLKEQYTKRIGQCSVDLDEEVQRHMDELIGHQEFNKV